MEVVMTQAAMKQSVVSERALFARLDRQLKREDGIRLRKCPVNSKDFSELGRYYSTDGNSIQSTNIDLEVWGRECGALEGWEVVKEED